jgi:hypothetical protein
MIQNHDKQIAATQAGLGLVKEQPLSIKILHSLADAKFDFAPTKPKRTTLSTTKAQDSREPEDLKLDLQLASAKAELDRLRLKGDNFRYRREQQSQNSQDNLKEKTLSLETSIKRLLKVPDSLTRQIVEQTFNDPFRNRFCLNLEVKTVQAIANMWWMHRQLVLQFEALDDLNELLDLQHTKLQGKAHKHRARMLGILTEHLTEFQVEHEHQAVLEKRRFEISILRRQLLATRTVIQLDHQEDFKEVPLPPPSPHQTASIQLDEDELQEADLDQHRLDILISTTIQRMLGMPTDNIKFHVEHEYQAGELEHERLEHSMLNRQLLPTTTTIQLDHQESSQVPLPPPPAPPRQTANIQLVEDESHEAELDQHRLEISILKRKQLLALPSTTIQLDGELDQHRLKMSMLKRQQLTPKAPGGLPPHPAPPITTNTNTNTPKGGTTSLSPSIQARKRHRSQCCPVLRGYEKWQILRRKQPLGSLSINIAPF